MVQWLRYLLIFLGIGLLLFLVWYLRSIIAYIVISWVLSLIGDPIVDFFSKRKIKKFKFPRSVVAGITVLATWVIIVFAFVILIPVIMQQAQELGEIDVQNVINNLQEPIGQLETWIAKYHLIENPNQIAIDSYIAQKIVTFIDLSDLSTVLALITGVFGNIFVAVFSISFITFFFLKEEDLFSRMLFTFIPPKYEEKTIHSISSIKKLLSRYFIGISIEVLLIMTFVTLGMSLVGLEFKNALIIGIFAGLINVIPYVGPLLGILFGLFIGIVTHLDFGFFDQILPLLGFILLVFAIIQTIDNVVFQPLIYSSSVNAHPLEIFLVIMIAGNLAGISGMILAIPSYTVLRVILKEFFSKFSFVKKMTESIEN